MRSTRGVTLVEMLIATALTAVVIGSVTSLFGFITVRAARSVSQSSAQEQADRVADDIEHTIRSAIECQVLTNSNGQALRCTMPKRLVDRDLDGRPEDWGLWVISRRGALRYGAGGRVWFYRADANGAFNTSGAWVWRAHTTDDTAPAVNFGGVVAAADRNWASYPGESTSKHYLVTGLAFSVNSGGTAVTFSVTASSLTRDDRPMSSPSDQGYAVTRTRTVLLANKGLR